MKYTSLRSLWMLLLLIALLPGCASIQKSNTIENERLLLAAGFKKQMADTPELQEQVKQMQQREVISKNENNKISYYYADAEDCQCLFTGTDVEFQRYRELKPLEYEAERRYNPASNWYWP